MFITTRKTKDHEFHKTFWSEFGEFTFSQKSYLIEANMVEWIQNHLIPYVMQIRSDIGNDDHPVVLLIDNLEQHFSEKVISELEKIKPYILVPLSPHSSHMNHVCLVLLNRDINKFHIHHQLQNLRQNFLRFNKQLKLFILIIKFKKRHKEDQSDFPDFPDFWKSKFNLSFNNEQLKLVVLTILFKVSLL